MMAPSWVPRGPRSAGCRSWMSARLPAVARRWPGPFHPGNGRELARWNYADGHILASPALTQDPPYGKLACVRDIRDAYHKQGRRLAGANVIQRDALSV